MSLNTVAVFKDIQMNSFNLSGCYKHFSTLLAILAYTVCRWQHCRTLETDCHWCDFETMLSHRIPQSERYSSYFLEQENVEEKGVILLTS